MGDILFLAHRVPYPPDRGDRIRAYNILKHLAARRRVHVAAFAEDPRDTEVEPGLGDAIGECVVVPRGKPMWRAGLEAIASGQPVSVTAFTDDAMRSAVDGLLKRHDIGTIFVFSSQMAQYVPKGSEHRFVMDFCDVDAAKFMQYGEQGWGPKAKLMQREGRLLLAHDRAVAERADASLFVSEAEAALFARLTGADGVQAIANGIDTEAYDPAKPAAPVAEAGELIVFTGQMDYPPNVEAVTWFANDILPRVRARRPAARFAIVGRAPTAGVKRLGDLPGVTVTGEVADVRGWLSAAAVVVAPLKLARGVQNKVLEAMAMARPVVVSPAAAKGIDHGGTVLVGQDADQLADRIVGLLADPVAASELGARARDRVVSRYGWDATLAPLDAIVGLDDDEASPPQSAHRDAA